METNHLYHGIKYSPDKQSGEYHFGFYNLLSLLEWNFRVPRFSIEEHRYEWNEHWIDTKFDRAFAKLSYLVTNFERATNRFTNCLEAIQQNHNKANQESSTIYSSALLDVPLFLDLILIYFRQQADCVANVIPNFYSQQGKIIPRDSFRKLLTWFTKKNRGLDPEYSDILQNNQGWFINLAGESHGQGLRDILMHNRGTYQFNFGNVQVEDSEQFIFRVTLLNESGIIDDDLLSTLRKMIADYYVFLDLTYIHFRDKLRATFQDQSILAKDDAALIFSFPSPLSSLWIFPAIDAGPSDAINSQDSRIII